MFRQLPWGIGAAAVLAMSGCASKIEPECSVGRATIDGSTGSHTALLELKPGEDATRPCAQLSVINVGLQKMYPNGPSGIGSVILQTEAAGELASDNAERLTSGKPYALGEFTDVSPGPDNFCEVQNVAPATLVFAAAGTEPAANYAWAWSNLRIFNTASIPGTYFTADLAYTEGTCTANYSVRAIWPVTSCKGDSGPDVSLCANKPDVSAGIGSKINPLFPTKCHPTALVCVLDGEVQTQ